MTKSNAGVGSMHADPQRSDRRKGRRGAAPDAQRSMVLDAARAAFFELGLEDASVRAIAKRSGYMPGALYSYYTGPQYKYAAALGDSLERLSARVQAVDTNPEAGASVAATPRESIIAALRRKATALFDFYLENPRDLNLGFQRVQGMQPRGMTPELNRQLNAQLRNALAPAQQGLRELGLDAHDAQAEVTALFAQIVGLLMLSHNGRIRMFKHESQRLFEGYLEALLARVAPQAIGHSRRRGAAKPAP